MKLEKYVIWIFAVLLLGVVLLMLNPTPAMLAFGTIFLPLLIVVQAVLILRSKGGKKKEFDEDDWYEHR